MSGVFAPVPVPAPGWIVPEAPATLESVAARLDSPMLSVLAMGVAEAAAPIRREAGARRKMERSGAPPASVELDDHPILPAECRAIPLLFAMRNLFVASETAPTIVPIAIVVVELTESLEAPV